MGKVSCVSTGVIVIERDGGLAFRDIRGLVVPLAEPLEVLVFQPGHPLLVLVVVDLLHPLGVGLLLALFLRQVVVDMALLFFGVPAGLAGAAEGVVDGVHFEKVWIGLYVMR